jgi:hypothetical protein
MEGAGWARVDDKHVTSGFNRVMTTMSAGN